MDGGATVPSGTEDTTVTLGSNSGEASRDGYSSHTTHRASALTSTEVIEPWGPQGSNLVERPYKFLQRGQPFKKSSNPSSHREMHSRAKMYAREICGKAYSHEGTLQQHHCLHAGEQPYECSDCSMTFA